MKKKVKNCAEFGGEGRAFWRTHPRRKKGDSNEGILPGRLFHEESLKRGGIN